MSYGVAFVRILHQSPIPCSNSPLSPQCTILISHNAPFCNRNVHMCAHLQNGALWDICLVHCGICGIGLLTERTIAWRECAMRSISIMMMLQHRNSFHITGPFPLAASSHYWIQQIIISNRPISQIPQFHLSYIPQCTTHNRNVYISVLSGALWDIGQMHS